MALGGKTINYTLAIDLQTGQLTAESKKVAAELNLIKKQTGDTDLSMRDLSTGIKGVKQALSLISGAAVFGLISSQMGQLVDYAQQFHGRTRDAADQMERLGKFIKTSVGESGLFADIMEGIAWTAKAIVFGRAGGFGAAGQRDKQLAAIELEREKKAKEEIKKLTEQIANEEKAVNVLKKDGIRLNTELRDLAYERSRFFKDEILLDTEPLADANLQMAQAAMEADSEILISQKDILLESLASLDAIYEDNADARREKDIAADKAWYDEKQILLNTFVNGMIEGFASIGASLATGGNAFKAFGSIFLKTLGMLAIQFGSFLVAVGLGMSAVPEIFGFGKGIAAVAAGTALIVLGGALGALAGKIGGGGHASGASEREQRFSGSKFGSAGGGGQVINNYVTFTNAIGLDDRSRKEVAAYIGDELFKQNKLGRLAM